jgi:hypothetical protein
MSLGEICDIDDDTCQAVVARWQADTRLLPSVFRHPPRAGRLKSPEELPYAQVASEFLAQDAGTGYRLDRRKVTLTLRGTKEQASQGLSYALRIFNKNLGSTDLPGLVYPSGARFICWRPLTPGTLQQEETEKEGLDIWSGVIEAEVTSTRNP